MSNLPATLSALAIDDVFVELDGEKIPIFDEGAIPWCDAMAAACRTSPRRAGSTTPNKAFGA